MREPCEVHPDHEKSAAVLASCKAGLRPPTALRARGSLRLGHRVPRLSALHSAARGSKGKAWVGAEGWVFQVEQKDGTTSCDNPKRARLS